MKSFRLYLRETPPETQPEKCRDDYSAEELATFREEFRQRDERCRRQAIPVLILCAVFILGMLLPVEERLLSLEWRFTSCGGLMAASLYAAWLGTRRCPACRRATEEYLSGYCPNCGEKSISPATWYSSPKCQLCGTTSASARSRPARIRFCTSCGIKLQDKVD